MGASFLDTVLDGAKTRKDVTSWFQDAAATARVESGNSYSGDWNMMRGLTFNDTVFDSQIAAHNYVVNHTNKWDTALAVRFKASKPAPLTFPSPNGGYTHQLHLSGVDAPSLTLVTVATGGVILVADLVPAGKQEAVKKLATTLLAAAREAAKADDALRKFAQSLTSEAELDWKALKAARTAFVKTRAARDKALAAYRKVADPLYAKRKTLDEGVKWLVGGWAAS